jgi:glyoxylase-like metal-dependent hydrolase (beta-lactamase superfamily II)
VRVHHLDCGSLRTIAPVNSASSPTRAVCHCMLVETDRDGLVLVDTGLGVGDVQNPRRRLGADWVEFADPVCDPDQTAVRQIARLGFAPEDVRHIVLTHLHRDHTGGLPDFPDAAVHVHEAEHRAVTDPTAEHHRHSLDRFMPTHRAHGPRWVVARPRQADTWLGFEGVARLDGLSEEILLVPLPGHTPGHSGVAVRLAEGWVLHAGDAYFYHGELQADPPVQHPELQLVQEGSQVDPECRLDGMRRLRDLYRRHGEQVDIFCAHDPWEFLRAARVDSPDREARRAAGEAC